MASTDRSISASARHLFAAERRRERSFFVLDTSNLENWQVVRNRYSVAVPCAPLNRVIELAQLHHVQSVVVELRYQDPDYRSEYTRYFAGKFRHHAPICHRLHFFRSTVRAADVTRLDQPKFSNNYVGYSVMRLNRLSPVGRTMMLPPPFPEGLVGARWCLAVETVRPFGCRLAIKAMPFMSQDGHFGTCADVVLWTVLYHAHLRYAAPRFVLGDIRAARSLVSVGDVRSDGTFDSDIAANLRRLGLSPSMRALPADSRLNEKFLHHPWLGTTADLKEAARRDQRDDALRRFERNVDSQVPTVVLSKHHSWTVVGHGENASSGALVLYCHDDGLGPYCRVDNPWFGGDIPLTGEWLTTIVPLPPRVSLRGDEAEEVGIAAFLGQPFEPSYADKIADGSLTFRTYLLRSNAFKKGVVGRVPGSVADLYRKWSFPGFVWIVEAHDASLECEQRVVGEVIVDATAYCDGEIKDVVAHPDVSPVLAIHVAGKVRLEPVNGFRGRNHDGSASFASYRTGCFGGS